MVYADRGRSLKTFFPIFLVLISIMLLGMGPISQMSEAASDGNTTNNTGDSFNQTAPENIIWNSYEDIPGGVDLPYMPIILYFHADWCGFCADLEAETFKNPDIISTAVDFFSVKIDGDDSPSLVKKFDVEGYPTVVFINTSGEEYNRIKGYVGPGDFMTAMTTDTPVSSAPTCPLESNSWILFGLIGIFVAVLVINYVMERRSRRR